MGWDPAEGNIRRSPGIMAGNGNIQPSCDDSALSINIIGILTLAYAIIITLAFHVNQLLAAKKTLKNLGDRLLDEVCTLEFASEWVQSLTPHIPEELKYEARAVQNFEVPVKRRFIKDLISEDAYTPAWLILFQQGNFLARRAEAETYLERFVWARREMQNFGHKVTQRCVILDTWPS